MSPPLIIFWTVIVARFVLPLWIPRFPLPAIAACLIVDAIDQPIFETFTRVDLASYQSYDKALDIFYLSVAMLAMYRNWKNLPALEVGRILFYLRLVGVLAFELTEQRWLLFLLPNAFEYYFIFVEVIRSRWSSVQLGARFYLAAAATIWLLKLPQEYWIHIARLDFTDEVKSVVLHAPDNEPWMRAIKESPLSFGLMLGAFATLYILGRAAIQRFVGPPKHALKIAADPLPEGIDEAFERERSMARSWRLFDHRLAEKIILVAFVTVIFARMVPGVEASPWQLVAGTGAVVTINAFLRLSRSPAALSLNSGVLSFVVLGITNAIIALIADSVLRLDMNLTMFFVVLLTLIVTLYDRWRPIYEFRFKIGHKRRAR